MSDPSKCLKFFLANRVILATAKTQEGLKSALKFLMQCIQSIYSFLTLPTDVIYENPDLLIPADPKKILIPDPAPKVAPNPAPGKP